jgi:hypothetical protein
LKIFSMIVFDTSAMVMTLAPSSAILVLRPI